MLRIEVPGPEAELVADELWAAGASAVGEEPGTGSAVVLTADLDACPPSLTSRPHAVSVDDGTWWDGWRPFARAVVAGPFLVRPPWVPADDPPPSAIELLLDAGRSFGTGSHPSTTLALAAMAPFVTGRTAVLDVGCGSGALAIGAALLGASDVLAVDVDPAAVTATAENAARNGVAERIRVEALAAGEVHGTFDVVVANLGAPLVFDLAPVLLAATVPDGVLVLGGMLGDHDHRIAAAYPDAVTLDRTEADGWTCVVFRAARAGIATLGGEQGGMQQTRRGAAEGGGSPR